MAATAWYFLVLHDISLNLMLLHGIARIQYCMALYVVVRCCKVLFGAPPNYLVSCHFWSKEHFHEESAVVGAFPSMCLRYRKSSPPWAIDLSLGSWANRWLYFSGMLGWQVWQYSSRISWTCSLASCTCCLLCCTAPALSKRMNFKQRKSVESKQSCFRFSETSSNFSAIEGTRQFNLVWHVVVDPLVHLVEDEYHRPRVFQQHYLVVLVVKLELHVVAVVAHPVDMCREVLVKDVAHQLKQVNLHLGLALQQ